MNQHQVQHQNQVQQISPQEFVDHYPDLLAHYQALVKKTELLAELKRRFHISHFDSLTAAATKEAATARSLAEEAFRAATTAAFDRQREKDRAANAELNCKLGEYLAILARDEAPILANCKETLAQQESEWRVLRQSLLDLGFAEDQIAERCAPLIERCKLIVAEIDRRRQPMRDRYQAQVREAYDVYNRAVDENRDALMCFKDGPELELRRQLRRLDSESRSQLQCIARDRDDADFALRSQERADKARRLAILQDFLRTGDQTSFVQAAAAFEDELVRQLEESFGVI